jgi:hypothetical protein
LSFQKASGLQFPLALTVGQQTLQQGMNRPPHLKIRADYEFNVMVTRDLVLAGPYKGGRGNRAMKLKLKEKDLPPVQLWVTLRAAAKQMLD